MPISFDDRSVEDNQYDEVVEDLVVETPKTTGQYLIDSRMAEMEERLELIQYYKLLLNGGFFNNPPNQATAAKIEAEVAEFVLGRLDSLLNTTQSVSKAPESSLFTEDEIQSLKELVVPETYKILKEITSRVSGKIALGVSSKSAKASLPKLTVKSVPLQEKTKKTVAAFSTLQTKRVPVPKQNISTSVPKKTREVAQDADSSLVKKHFKTVARVNQATGEVESVQGKVEITPQARPLGAIQPIPAPTSVFEIEAQSEANARKVSALGLSIFDSKLTQ